MKAKTRHLSGSVKIHPDVLADAKKICKSNGWVLSAYITKIVEESNMTHDPKIKSKSLQK